MTFHLKDGYERHSKIPVDLELLAREVIEDFAIGDIMAAIEKLNEFCAVLRDQTGGDDFAFERFLAQVEGLLKTPHLGTS